MAGRGRFLVGKSFQALGLVAILIGLLASISAGFDDEGLKSMAFEMRGLMVGGALFLVGFAIERIGGGKG